MNYNDICLETVNFIGEKLEDLDEPIVVCFLSYGEKSYCYTVSDLERIRKNSEVNIWINGGSNQGPSIQSRPLLKLPYIGAWVDSSLIDGILNGHEIFYLYPAYTSEIGSFFWASRLHGGEDYDIYSAIPVKKQLFLDTPLPQLRSLLNRIIPDKTEKVKIVEIQRFIKELGEEKEPEEKDINDTIIEEQNNPEFIALLESFDENEDENIRRLNAFMTPRSPYLVSWLGLPILDRAVQLRQINFVNLIISLTNIDPEIRQRNSDRDWNESAVWDDILLNLLTSEEFNEQSKIILRSLYRLNNYWSTYMTEMMFEYDAVDQFKFVIPLYRIKLYNLRKVIDETNQEVSDEFDEMFKEIYGDDWRDRQLNGIAEELSEPSFVALLESLDEDENENIRRVKAVMGDNDSALSSWIGITMLKKAVELRQVNLIRYLASRTGLSPDLEDREENRDDGEWHEQVEMDNMLVSLLIPDENFNEQSKELLRILKEMDDYWSTYMTKTLIENNAVEQFRFVIQLYNISLETIRSVTDDEEQIDDSLDELFKEVYGDDWRERELSASEDEDSNIDDLSDIPHREDSDVSEDSDD